MTLDAVILAGGRARRLGGRSKPLLEFDGRTLLDRLVSAAHDADCGTVVVVGPPELALAGVTTVREEPAFGGPVAALAAALPSVTGDEVLLLAVDLVHGDEIVRRLAATPLARDGVCLVDSSGVRQWLAAKFHTAVLRAAIDDVPQVQSAALRTALATLDISELPVSDELVHDIDTPDDLEDPWRPTTS